MSEKVEEVREIMWSINYLSMAMLGFGTQQLLNFLKASNRLEADKAGRSFVAVAQAFEAELDPFFEDMLASGNRAQRSAVELGTSVFDAEKLRLERMSELSGEILRHSADAIRLLVSGETKRGDSGVVSCGWGPMPPAT